MRLTIQFINNLFIQKSFIVLLKSLIHLRIEFILLKFHWGMKALTEVHFQWSAVAFNSYNYI